MKIVTDSASLFSPEDGLKQGFTVIPACVINNGHTYRDFEDISSEDFLHMIEKGDVPTSSQPAIGDVLEVFEDNKPLHVRQIYQADPLYVVTSPAITLKNSRKHPKLSRRNCNHLFYALRTSPPSTIKIRTTDPFGRVHEEIFTGNKPFSQNMK